MARVAPDLSNAEPKKTNSLAFSRTSCHTCLRNNVACDRRRPKCATCTEQGWRCGGYATPLLWHDSRMWLGRSLQQGEPFEPSQNCTGAVRKTTGRSTASHSGQGGQRQSVQNSARSFRFVGAGARVKRRRTESNVQTSVNADQTAAETSIVDSAHVRGYSVAVNPDHSSAPIESLRQPDISQTHGQLAAQEQNTTSDLPPLDPLSTLTETSQNIQPPAPLHESDYLPDISPLGDADMSRGASGDVWDMFAEYFQDMYKEPSEVLFSNLVDFVPTVMQNLSPEGAMNLITEAIGPQHTWLLEKYDSEFCVLPVTSDMSVNPFRFRKHRWQKSPLLLHAILALCCQHVACTSAGEWAKQATEHLQEATRLLESASSHGMPAGRHDLYLLDPILVMFTLDCTVSAYGRWNRHLERARRLLDDSGGPSTLDTGQRRAQVGMLVWWDVTLALVSRQGLKLKSKYFDYLVSKQHDDQWTFFELTGCPDDLLKYVVRLAELAQQREIAETMVCLTFDMSAVDQIERAVKEWRNVDMESFEPKATDELKDPQDACNESNLEDECNARLDQYHCSEAWRQALLIYIQRVFRWSRKGTASSSLKIRARQVLDHVRCCRYSSQTQKQVLLPVFLAGGEIMDQELRQSVKNYCDWWALRSRYKMFCSVPELLEEVWLQDNTSNVWWGSVIDDKSGNSDGKDGYQYLFG